jgi:hypothetical protein
MDKKEPKLSKKAIQDINKSKERITDGEIYTEEEAKRILKLLKR